MATPEEIQRRIDDNDAARSAKRASVAKRVGDLAQRRSATAERLADIERELGDVLVDAQDVIDVDELAKFTDVAATDLTQWLSARTARKASRGKRKQSPAGPVNSGPSGKPSQSRTSKARPATTPQPAAPRGSGQDPRVPAEVP